MQRWINSIITGNLIKYSTKQLYSLTTPCIHAYIRDMWYLDIKTNIWVEVKPSGEMPTARSGHRMVVWRNYIVLFGGFYEALRDVKWYNDLYLFSLQEERWIHVGFKSHAQGIIWEKKQILCWFIY